MVLTKGVAWTVSYDAWRHILLVGVDEIGAHFVQLSNAETRSSSDKLKSVVDQRLQNAIVNVHTVFIVKVKASSQREIAAHV